MSAISPSPTAQPHLPQPNDLAWQNVLCDIRDKVGANAYDLWFAELSLKEVVENVAVVIAPGSIYPIWIEGNFKDALYSSVSNYIEGAETVRFEVDEGAADGSADASGAREQERDTVVSIAQDVARRSGGTGEGGTGEGKGRKKKKKKLVSEEVSEEEIVRRGLEGGLVENYRFDNFVIGDNCEAASAAAHAVANKPGRTYQPLYYHSQCGLGKTHLLHAIGWEALRQRPNSTVLYVSAEKFANDYIDAIQNNALVGFRKKYREADMLLIDDIQFLERKRGLQDEFFHTFNSLSDLHKQIVLASDCPASQISQLEDRLVSRFQWGLTVEIHRPGEATREAILRRKRDDWNLRVDDATIGKIVDRVEGNVRLLEGALIRVAMLSTMAEEPITDSMIDETLSDICDTHMAESIGMQEIKNAVAENWGLEVKALEGKGRTAKVAEARQVAMYLIRTLTDHSLVETASAFGRDHATVMYAVKKVRNRLEQSPSLRNTVELIKRRMVRGGRRGGDGVFSGELRL